MVHGHNRFFYTTGQSIGAPILLTWDAPMARLSRRLCAVVRAGDADAAVALLWYVLLSGGLITGMLSKEDGERIEA
eukprot:COSAG02_NODE_3410_length_6788_cov_20.669009_3_plen_76_part_00